MATMCSISRRLYDGHFGPHKADLITSRNNRRNRTMTKPTTKDGIDNDTDNSIINTTTNIHHQHHHAVIYQAPGIQINSHAPVRSDKVFDILFGQQGVLISSCGMYLRCRASPPDIAINRIISGNRCLKERRRREGGRHQGASGIYTPTNTARSIHPVTYLRETARRGDASPGANVEEMALPYSILKTLAAHSQ